MFLFSGGCPSAYIKQSLSIHSTSGNGGKPVKKIPASAAVLLTIKVEVQSPYNRISISHNRRGHRAFAVFLLSFFIGIRRRTVTDVRCRSPPLHLDFYISSQAKACSIQIDWRKKEWHITTDVRTGSGVSGKKPRKKCCGNMELMKLPSNKSVLTTGQTLIPTGGFTIGQAISGNTLREWQTGNSQPK